MHSKHLLYGALSFIIFDALKFLQTFFWFPAWFCYLSGMNKSWNLFLISAVVKVSDQLFWFLITLIFGALSFLTCCQIFVISRRPAWYFIIGQSCTLVEMHKLKFKSLKVSKCTMFARKVLQFCLSHHLSAPPGIEPWGKNNNISKDSDSMS